MPESESESESESRTTALTSFWLFSISENGVFFILAYLLSFSEVVTDPTLKPSVVAFASNEAKQNIEHYPDVQTRGDYTDLDLLRNSAVDVKRDWTVVLPGVDSIDEFRMVFGGQRTPFCFYQCQG